MARRLPSWVYLTFADIGTNHHFARFHRWLYHLMRGRGPVNSFLGLDVILLTTTGRRSGRPRTVPVGAVRHGDRWLVVGSNAGKDLPPAWALNLEAHSAASVDTGTGPMPFTSRIATGEEADRLWSVAIEAYPGYTDYQRRTHRELPLIVLERV